MKLKTVIDMMRRWLSPDIQKHEAAGQGMPPSPCGEDGAHYQALSAKMPCPACTAQENHRAASRDENRRMLKQAKYVVEEMARAQREGRLQ